MKKLLATVLAELLVLRRDRAGLLLLFAMPAVLVVVITLIQENVNRLMAEGEITVLFLDDDQGEVGHSLRQLLAESPSMELIDRWGDAGREALIDAIREGRAEAGVVVPRDTTATVRRRSHDFARRLLEPGEPPPAAGDPVPGVAILFEPTAGPSLRGRVRGAVERAALLVEMRERAAAFLELLAAGLPTSSSGPGALGSHWAEDRLLPIAEQPAFAEPLLPMPTAVQHNVPAWGLFGMFFVVVPMASSLVAARDHGILRRLFSMPVSPASLLCGKALAYGLVCLLQLASIIAIGRWLLPRLGTAELELGTAPAALTVVALGSALAATSFGLLLGAAAKTQQQVTTCGPLAVVIAAAVGGIMVPIAAMPRFLQQLSAFCPLAWAHEAFLDILVRNGSMGSVAAEVSLLSGLAVLMIGLASFLFWRQGS